MRGSATPGKSRPAQINLKQANPATGPPTFLPDPTKLVKHFTYDGQGRLIRVQSPYPDAATWSGGGSSGGRVRSERFFYGGVRRVQELYVDPVLSIDGALGSGASVAPPSNSRHTGSAGASPLRLASLPGSLDRCDGGGRLSRRRSA